MIENNFPFFIIETVGDSRGMQLTTNFPYDGVLGLSPNVDGNSLISLGVPIPVLLKNNGKITNAIVGIDMNRDVTVPSSITLGVIDQTKFRNKTE